MWRLPIFVLTKLYSTFRHRCHGVRVGRTGYRVSMPTDPVSLVLFSDSSTYERARARAHTRTYRYCTGTHINEPSCSG